MWSCLRWIPRLSDSCETEDLLEMVNAGLIPATIADSHVAGLWQQTARWLPQVVLGLFLWQAATQGERSAVRQELLAGRAERG